jgi:hypothetical protein
MQGVLDDLPELASVVAQSALTAGLLGGLALTISAFTPRRAYAVAGIIALFIIPSLVAGIVVGIGSVEIGQWLVLLSATSVLDGTNAFLFNLPQMSEFEGFVLPIPPVAFFATTAAGIVGSIGLSIRRFQRITA